MVEAFSSDATASAAQTEPRQQKLHESMHQFLNQTTPADQRAELDAIDEAAVKVPDQSSFSVPAITMAYGAGAYLPHPMVDNPVAYVALPQQKLVHKVYQRTGEVLATVGVGKRPVSLAMNQNGSMVYVVNADSHTVSMLDTRQDAVIKDIEVGQGPCAIAMSKIKPFAYVANGQDNTVSVINTIANKVAQTIEVGKGPSSIAVHPTYPLAYVTNSKSDTLSIINTGTHRVIRTLPIRKCPLSIHLSEKGLFAYVANAQQYSVSVIELPANTVTGVIRLPAAPYQCYLDKASGHLYVGCMEPPNKAVVLVVDTATFEVLQTLPAASSPLARLMPDPTQVLMSRGWLSGGVLKPPKPEVAESS